MSEQAIRMPWLASKDPEVPESLTYSKRSMCGVLEEMAQKYPEHIAYEFMGKETTYARMWDKIVACGKALKAIGIREGDKVTICMPNCPQAISMFYAVNMVGAIANMIHPLSAESEIAFYLRDSGSVAALAAQIIATNPFFRPGDTMLAIMPIFHGFGLGVSIHSMLANGGHCILIPRFTPKTYAELLKKHHPNLIAGVPSLYEAVLRLDGHEFVQISCVIGVPDPIRIQKVKAFVVLKSGYVPTEACKKTLMEYCRKHIARYALPYDIEFREELPKTLVGKVAYRILEEEELAKMKGKENG